MIWFKITQIITKIKLINSNQNFKKHKIGLKLDELKGKDFDGKYSDLIKYHSKKDDPNLLDLFEY